VEPFENAAVSPKKKMSHDVKKSWCSQFIQPKIKKPMVDKMVTQVNDHFHIGPLLAVASKTEKMTDMNTESQTRFVMRKSRAVSKI
jgi:hypothetical protein